MCARSTENHWQRIEFLHRSGKPTACVRLNSAHTMNAAVTSVLRISRKSKLICATARQANLLNLLSCLYTKTAVPTGKKNNNNLLHNFLQHNSENVRDRERASEKRTKTTTKKCCKESPETTCWQSRQQQPELLLPSAFLTFFAYSNYTHARIDKLYTSADHVFATEM